MSFDYVAVDDSVTFAANETQKTISISIIEDSLDEDEESFSVSLTGASQGAVQESESAANVSVEDNDDTPSIRISGSNNIVEGDTLNINVTLAAESGRAVSVNLQNTDVQAIAGEDFNALNETVTFAPGETSKVVTLSTIDDAIDEIDEDLIAQISCCPVSDIDLLIRTGGDRRISNFLLYQIAYTEINFVDKYWPDFKREDFIECLDNFKKVSRRFGKRI